MRGLPRFDGRSSFRTWSYRVATNACLDELRRRQRRPLVGLEPAAEPVNAGVEQQVVDRLVLDQALPAIDEDFRVAVVLRDVGGLDYAEIGEVLGIPPGTVRSRISRGRRHLANLLGNQDDPS